MKEDILSFQTTPKSSTGAFPTPSYEHILRLFGPRTFMLSVFAATTFSCVFTATAWFMLGYLQRRDKIFVHQMSETRRNRFERRSVGSLDGTGLVPVPLATERPQTKNTKMFSAFKRFFPRLQRRSPRRDTDLFWWSPQCRAELSRTGFDLILFEV